MELAGKSKLLFVINPVSGGKNKILIEIEIRKYFENLPIDLLFINLTGKEDDLLVKQNILRFQPDKVIVVGGDGTIKLLAQQLMGTEIPLGIIPAGSANGMARELDIPFSVIGALDTIMHGMIQKVDLILFNNKEISIHISDIGLNAFLVRYYSKNRLRGKWGYAKALVSVLWHRKLLRAEVIVNGEAFIRKAYMIILANARSYGTGVIINPSGQLRDGKFEIIIMKKISIWQLAKQILTNSIPGEDEMEVIQTSEVIIHTHKKVYFQIDGEYRGKVNSLNAVILPAALNLLLPAR